MSLEEVAEGYLRELIHRSLVQVVSIKIDGRAKSCRVHDLVHAMIQKKFEDLSLCKNISEDGQSTLTGIARRLSITNSDNSTLESIESSQVRSLLILDPYPINDSFFKSIPTKYKLLKVLAYEPAKMEFEHVRAIRVPEDFGSLIHLKYFSILKQNGFAIIPKSIGMLENLETLDLTGSPPVDCYHEEFCKLINLRHFLGSEIPLTTLKNGIGGMTSLQSLEEVFLGPNEDVKVIEELGKLEQLKKLGLAGVRRKFMSVLSSSINKMKQMEKLTIKSPEEIDLHLNLPKLRYLLLLGQLEKLPEWIPNLEYLVKLKLVSSKLTEDPMKLLKSMPNLLSISLIEDAYVGETLHFQNGGFKNLKELHLHYLYDLKYIHIDKGTMLFL
jgi:disease resistance protein RPM1